jgi:hypothetical protein
MASVYNRNDVERYSIVACMLLAFRQERSLGTMSAQWRMKMIREMKSRFCDESCCATFHIIFRKSNEDGVLIL